jgi:hypothetical protein
MGWSAASAARGSPPGSEVVSYPAPPPVALLGARRAAPPGTRLTEDVCPFLQAQQKRWQNIKGDIPWSYTRIGIDLGKTSFHLVGLNRSGEVVVRKKFSRAQLLRLTANRRVYLIGMKPAAALTFSAGRSANKGTKHV